MKPNGWLSRVVAVGLSVFTLLAIRTGQARGEEPKKPELLARDTHVTKDGIHRGRIGLR